jgi:hypothetical protein
MKKTSFTIITSLALSTCLFTTTAFAKSNGQSPKLQTKEQAMEYVGQMSKLYPTEISLYMSEANKPTAGNSVNYASSGTVSSQQEVFNYEWGTSQPDQLTTVRARCTSGGFLYMYYTAEALSFYDGSGLRNHHATLGVTSYGLNPTLYLDGKAASGIASANSEVDSESTTARSVTITAEDIRTGWINLVKIDFICKSTANINGNTYSISTYATLWGA